MDPAPSLEEALYGELRALAKRRVAGERHDHTLQATALVNEAYLRLRGDGSNEPDWKSRAEFLGAAAVAMRRVLIDHARRRNRQKRGGGDAARVSLTQLDLAAARDVETFEQIDEALQDLANVDARAERVVQLRFFAGLSNAEVAEVLGVTDRTVRSDWAFARAWLFDRLDSSGEGAENADAL